MNLVEYHLGKVCGKNYLDNSSVQGWNVGWKNILGEKNKEKKKPRLFCTFSSAIWLAIASSPSQFFLFFFFLCYLMCGTFPKFRCIKFLCVCAPPPLPLPPLKKVISGTRTNNTYFILYYIYTSILLYVCIFFTPHQLERGGVTSQAQAQAQDCTQEYHDLCCSFDATPPWYLRVRGDPRG